MSHDKLAADSGGCSSALCGVACRKREAASGSAAEPPRSRAKLGSQPASAPSTSGPAALPAAAEGREGSEARQEALGSPAGSRAQPSEAQPSEAQPLEAAPTAAGISSPAAEAACREPIDLTGAEAAPQPAQPAAAEGLSGQRASSKAAGQPGRKAGGKGSKAKAAAPKAGGAGRNHKIQHFFVGRPQTDAAAD